MTPVFTAVEACKITGVAYTTLDFWTRTGLIRATMAPAQGSGTRRLYSRRDLVVLRLLYKLRLMGFSGQALSLAADAAQTPDIVIDLVEIHEEAVADILRAITQHA